MYVKPLSYTSILHKPSVSSSSHCTSSPLCTSPFNQSTSLALHIICCIETSILMTESGVKKVFLECLVQGMLLARRFARSNFRNSECDVTCCHMMSHVPWSKHVKSLKLWDHGSKVTPAWSYR